MTEDEFEEILGVDLKEIANAELHGPHSMLMDAGWQNVHQKILGEDSAVNSTLGTFIKDERILTIVCVKSASYKHQYRPELISIMGEGEAVMFGLAKYWEIA